MPALVLVIAVGLLAAFAYFGVVSFINTERTARGMHFGDITDAVPPTPQHVVNLPERIFLKRCDAGWAHLKLPTHAAFMGYRERGPILAEYQDEHGVWLDYKKRGRNTVHSYTLRFCALYPKQMEFFKFSDQFGHPLPLIWKAR